MKTLEQFYSYNIDFSTSTLYMGSIASRDDAEENGVDFLMAESVIKGLHMLDRKAHEITILMNSPGGDVYHGLAIYDAIQACKNHVTIKVFGHAMSMGATILQAADTRIMMPNSRFMMHYGYWGVDDHPKSSYNWADESKKIDKWCLNLYYTKIHQANPRITKKKVDEMLNFDTILDAEETVKLGLADSVFIL